MFRNKFHKIVIRINGSTLDHNFVLLNITSFLSSSECKWTVKVTGLWLCVLTLVLRHLVMCTVTVSCCEVTWGDCQTALSAYSITCAPLSQLLTPPVHQRLHVTEQSYGSVPHRRRERRSGEKREGVKQWRIAGEGQWVWGRLEENQGLGLNTESNSHLSHRRMSHLARHCAVNETERGGTPAERGCRVCERGWESITHSLRGKKKQQNNQIPQILSMKVGGRKSASHRREGGNTVYDKKLNGDIGVHLCDDVVRT